jgi:hypothetical protein
MARFIEYEKKLIPMPHACSRFLVVLFITAGEILYLFVDLFVIPFYLMKMTGIYYAYKEESTFVEYVSGKNKERLNNWCSSDDGCSRRSVCLF